MIGIHSWCKFRTCEMIAQDQSAHLARLVVAKLVPRVSSYYTFGQSRSNANVLGSALFQQFRDAS